MTTEPSVRTSPLELRLYVAALLAAVYTVSWRAIAPAAEPSRPTTPQRFVWIDSVPPSMRPVVVLPAGWQLASEPRSSVAPTERVVRVPSRRVRTRSS